jgi:TRAP-type C4-dicarboxylate transport system permease large subunit
LVPVARAFGINDIQFAMMFIFNNAIGAISTPMGMLMFVTCSITNCKIGPFIKEAVPFYALLFICPMLLTFVTIFSLGLVNLVY